MAKYPKQAIGHMCSHFDRSANNIGNENIEPEKTKENYNLAPERNLTQIEFINQRCGEIKCLNRKDVNAMCSWVVTAPKSLPPSDERTFFEETYKFLSKRYGEKNVVSAYVHKDEKQPHLHFAFVPVVIDKKKGHEKLSARECVPRQDLQTFHSDLEKHLAAVFGREVGILNDATREGNKSIEELKRLSAVERLTEVNRQAEQLISDAKNEALHITTRGSQERELINKDIKVLIEEKNQLQGQINEFKDVLKSNNDIDAMGHRSHSLIGGDKVAYTIDEDKSLKEIAKERNTLKVKVSILEREVARLKEYELRVTTTNQKYNDLNRDVRMKDSKIKHMEKIINSDDELKNMFNRQEHKVREIQAKRRAIEFEQ